MTNSLIIGNLLSFIGMVFLGISCLKNKKEEIIFFQIFDCVFEALANIVLGGFSGAAVMLTSAFRNVLVYSGKITNALIFFIMAAMVVLGLSFNNHGWIGTFPVIANLEYTAFLCYGGCSPLKIKIALAVNVFIWAVYDFTILAIPAFTTDIIIFIITLYGIYKSYNRQKI